MPKLHPQILTKNGKEEFVVLPYEEFVAIQQLLADAQDLLELRQARDQSAEQPRTSLEEVRRRFGVTD